MNAIIALMIIGGGIAFVLALVSILDKTEKARLLRQAENAADKRANDLNIPPPDEPDEAWWGNSCLVLLYIDAAMVVTSMARVAQVIPAEGIRECSATSNVNNNNIGRSCLTLTLNDPTNPEVNLYFPGDGAAHAARAIVALIASALGVIEVPATVVVFEKTEEELELEDSQSKPSGRMIDSTPHHPSNVIMDMPMHENEKGETLVIN